MGLFSSLFLFPVWLWSKITGKNPNPVIAEEEQGNPQSAPPPTGKDNTGKAQ